MQLTVKIIDGAVRQSIRNVNRAIPEITFRRMFRLFQNAAARRKEYPPEPPNSTYVRTGEFGASVAVERLGAGEIGARFTIGAKHAIIVGGDSMGMGQASVHEGRWELTRDIVEAEVTDQVSETIDADLTQVIQQQGMGL